MISPEAWIHESSVIDPDVHLGAQSKVWLFCHLLSGTRIGERCSIGQNCVIGPRVHLGHGVRIQNNVSVFEGVTLKDDVFVGPSVVFTNISNPRAFIPRKDRFQPTVVECGASLGANCTIRCGVTIGHHALIGAGSVVTKDVPSFALVLGNPARRLGFVSLAGNRLHFNADGLASDPTDQSRYRLVDADTVELLS